MERLGPSLGLEYPRQEQSRPWVIHEDIIYHMFGNLYRAWGYITSEVFVDIRQIEKRVHHHGETKPKCHRGKDRTCADKVKDWNISSLLAYMDDLRSIKVDNGQIFPKDEQLGTRLPNNLWHALHQTLLHEHHNFFLAIQHPEISSALYNVSRKYAMPARMWRHGIHSLLEHRSRISFTNTLSFACPLYTTMTLLSERYLRSKRTWIQCLNDLAMYRVIIEDDDSKGRELCGKVWIQVCRNWYFNANEKLPTAGRLHHHLAILAQLHVPQQFFYYPKSTTVSKGVPSTKNSLMVHSDPILNRHQNILSPFDAAFATSHGIRYKRKTLDAEVFHGVSEAICILEVDDNGSTTKTATQPKTQAKGIHRNYLLALLPRFCMLFYSNPLLLVIIAASKTHNVHAAPHDTQLPRVATPEVGSSTETQGINLYWYFSVLLLSISWAVFSYFNRNSALCYAMASLGWLLVYLFRTFGPAGDLMEAASVGLASLVFFSLWLSRASADLRPESRRVAVVASVAFGFILDILMAGFAGGESSRKPCTKVFGANECADIFIFALAILPPSIVLGTFCLWGIGQVHQLLRGAIHKRAPVTSRVGSFNLDTLPASTGAAGS